MFKKSIVFILLMAVLITSFTVEAGGSVADLKYKSKTSENRQMHLRVKRKLLSRKSMV